MAVPAGLYLTGAGIGWGTPDGAAIDAISHMTGEEISNALDLRKTLASGGYKLWTDGSMHNWRGHVGEAQIAEQIESWSSAGTLQMPPVSNFGGADLSIFDRDFQVKFVSDFNSIDNKHGDALIVPEGTEAVPADAVSIDFSQPFDPSLLDGHDVIIAEGLTLAGAEDAWQSAAGLAAGGLDVGDVADAADMTMIPGLGAAIRIASSGYRRRAALADPALRRRATKKVARDTTYGVAGVGAGGTTGALIGAGIDVLSLGATLGLGTWIGGTLGTVGGAKGASQLAAADDERAVDAARGRVDSAVLAYGAAAEETQSQADKKWRDAQSDSNALAATQADRRREQARSLATLATTELETCCRVTEKNLRSLLVQAERLLRLAAQSGLSRKGRRDFRAWRQRSARVSGASGEQAEEALLLVVAVPDGDELVAEWLRQRFDRRAVILAATEITMSAVYDGAVEDRALIATKLDRARSDIREEASRALQHPAERVERLTTKLKEELKLNGT